MPARTPPIIILVVALITSALPLRVGASDPAVTAAPTTTDLWPEDKMPGRGAREAEIALPARGDNVVRLTNVSRPSLMVFPSNRSKEPSPAVIVCPGGGYGYLAFNKEGTEIAAWLNSAGFTALVLKYRVPNLRDGAMQDLQRALSLARARAPEWNLDPHRLGVIGFSAGGHLAAKASTGFEKRAYPPLDAADQQSCRPDFAMLVYPAYLEKDGKIADELNLKANIPPTLIVHSEDDQKFVPGSKLYHAALDAAGISNEFKLYPTGGHGYALHCEREARAWPEAALEWVRKAGREK